jgi:hypothetical protein
MHYVSFLFLFFAILCVCPLICAIFAALSHLLGAVVILGCLAVCVWMSGIFVCK